MARMTETEKQARREAVINSSVSAQIQSLRDWYLMLTIINVSPQIRSALLDQIRNELNRMIDADRRREAQ